MILSNPFTNFKLYALEILCPKGGKFPQGITMVPLSYVLQHQAKEEVILLVGIIKTDKQGKRD